MAPGLSPVAKNGLACDISHTTQSEVVVSFRVFSFWLRSVPVEISPATVVSHDQSSLTAKIYDGIMLMTVPGELFYGFNESAKRIWQLTAQPISLRDLCACFEEEYDIDPQQCRQDVATFVEQLVERDIIKVCPAPLG